MCWFSMAKTLMFVFNVALFFAGIATLVVGIVVSKSSDGSLELIGIAISENGAIVLIVAGSIALVMGFLGCYGAKEESTGLLGLYFVSLLIIVVLQIAVGIWAAAQFDSIDEVVDKSFNALNLTDTDNVDTMNNIAQQFQCCGRVDDGCADISTYGLNCDCEPDDYATCEKVACGTIYTQSCPDAVSDFVNENMRIIAGIGIGIGLAEILGLVISMCMCQTLKDARGYA